MTEAKWLGEVLVASMLYCLRDQGATSQRQLRLFAVACCRGAWGHLGDERSWAAVVVAERFADGLGDPEMLADAADGALDALRAACGSRGYDIHDVLRKAPAVFPRGAPAAIRWASAAAYVVADDAGRAAWAAEGVANTKELAANCDLIRCIFGNPFRPVTLAPAGQTPAVVSLAYTAYDNRAPLTGTLEPERLAILADALEDAGCTDTNVLDHLRSPGPHVRGCWVIDRILGRRD